MKSIRPLILLMSVVAAGCAGTIAPAARTASAQAAIRSAREVGAEQTPTAALYLQYAREQFGQADQLSRQGEGERAERVLLRSQADAELAIALAHRTTSRAAADHTALSHTP